LLSYTCLLKGLEIRSLFSSASLSLISEKIFWWHDQNVDKSLADKKTMTLSIENGNKQSIFLLF
jgi:hypothetical protein